MGRSNSLVSLLLWVIILLGSWSLSQKASVSYNSMLSWQSHVAIQMGLQEFVTNQIQEKLPDSQDIVFTSLWSEYLGEGNVKVFFEYAFKHPLDGKMTQSQLKGHALLKPQAENPQVAWVIQKVQINQEVLSYAPEVITLSDPSDSMPEKETGSVPTPPLASPYLPDESSKHNIPNLPPLHLNK